MTPKFVVIVYEGPCESLKEEKKELLSLTIPLDREADPDEERDDDDDRLDDAGLNNLEAEERIDWGREEREAPIEGDELGEVGVYSVVDGLVDVLSGSLTYSESGAEELDSSYL